MFQLLVLSSLLALACGATLPLDPARGTGQTPIIGGELAVITDVPWMVSLEYFMTHRCGGSIISPTVVLTAGSCVWAQIPDFWVARAGSSFLESGGQEVDVLRMVTHPSFSSVYYDYDIAVAILSSPLLIDNVNTRIVALPTSSQTIPTGASGLVAGWGSTSSSSQTPSRQLRKVIVPVVDQTICVEAYEDTFYPIKPRMFCAGEKGKDACTKDYGGPFIVDDLLVGVISYARNCDHAVAPRVYSRVPVMVDWIKAQI